MALCHCAVRAQCERIACDESADWSVWQPGGPKFMCEWHWQEYESALKKRIPGLDPPRGASDFWRPSIIEIARQGIMEMMRLKRVSEPPPPRDRPISRDHRLPPAQRATLMRLRELQRRAP